MLRWCLPTVRAVGGRGDALFSVLRRRSCCQATLPVKLANNTGMRGDSSPASIPVSVSINAVPASNAATTEVPGSDVQHGAQLAIVYAKGSTALVHGAGTCDESLGEDILQSNVDNQEITSEAPSPHPSLQGDCFPTEPTSQSSFTPDLTNLTAIFRLKQFLSYDPRASPVLNVHSPSVIRSFYFSARAHSHLHYLSGSELTSLICLFGSLSLSTSTQPYQSVFAHPLVSSGLVREGSSRSNWKVVSLIAVDKEKLRFKLGTVGRYWLMRTRLAELEDLDRRDSAQDNIRASRALKSARAHYLQILNSSAHPEIHVSFLSALLSRSREDHLEEVIARFGHLFELHKRCHPQLRNVLWQVVLKPGRELPTTLKDRLLRMLSTRLVMNRTSPSDHLGSSPVYQYVSTSIEDLAALLTNVVFSSAIVVRSELHSWALSTTAAAFPYATGNPSSVQVAYNNLVLLALINAPSDVLANHQAYPSIDGNHVHGAIDFQVVCALVLLERMVHVKKERTYSLLSTDLAAGISRVLWSLWEKWSAWIPRDRLHSRVASLAIVASFVYLAGRTKDSRLLDSCQRFCMSKRLLIDPSSPSISPTAYSFISEWMIADIACKCDIENTLATISEWIASPEGRSAVVGQAIKRFASPDCQLAQRLLTSARHEGIPIPSQAFAQVIIALVNDGQLDLALAYLADASLTPQDMLDVIDAVVKIVAVHGHAILPYPLAIECSELMLRAFGPQPPPLSMRSDLESTLLTFARMGRAEAVVDIVSQVNMSYFSASFYTTLIKLLLRHRRFKLARIIFDIGSSHCPDHRAGWRRLLVQQYSRAGVHKLAANLMREVKVTKESLDSDAESKYLQKLIGVIRYRERSPEPVRTLKLSRFLSRRKIRNGPAVVKTVHLLVRSGRMRATKRLYMDIRESNDVGSQIAMGNDILHASMMHKSRRNVRQVRKVLNVMKDLVNNHSFAPDRVTMNIILKALLRWSKDFDSHSVRALFDHMVRSGYPTGGVVPANTPVFDTTAGSLLQNVPIPKLTSPVSFKKHVRPLYKMFIKALYVRGDGYAARKVVGILKILEAEADDEMQKRERGRSEGRRSA